MNRFQTKRPRLLTAALALTAILLLALSPMIGAADQSEMTEPFSGAKVNGGTVTFSRSGGKAMLTLSDDFVVPDTPDPHWQVVDSKGTVYLLERMKIKDDKYNKSIILPGYVKNVVRVQVWCAWAEALLGEAGFKKPVS